MVPWLNEVTYLHNCLHLEVWTGYVFVQPFYVENWPVGAVRLGDQEQARVIGRLVQVFSRDPADYLFFLQGFDLRTDRCPR